MCGFVGFSNLKREVSYKLHTLKEMTNSLAHRGPDEEDYYSSEHTMLGHRRLIIIDAKNGKQPMSFKINNINYTIVYNRTII